MSKPGMELRTLQDLRNDLYKLETDLEELKRDLHEFEVHNTDGDKPAETKKNSSKPNTRRLGCNIL